MGESVTITTPDGAFSAYVARPAAAKAPAIVVIQEIFGVNAVMRGLADGYAAEGFLAICPDLFWRIEPGVDITASVSALRALPECKGKVGALGFCLGGKLAYLAAAHAGVDCAVGY